MARTGDSRIEKSGVNWC